MVKRVFQALLFVSLICLLAVSRIQASQPLEPMGTCALTNGECGGGCGGTCAPYIDPYNGNLICGCLF
jgi:hypothetical protein